MDIKTLSIDLETRSGADIGKTGVYKYAEDPNFDILLFGVSVNGGPVEVYDLACGDTIPDEILAALTDNEVIKTAYNASFERVCLSYWLRRYYPQYFRSYGDSDDPAHQYLDPASWRCTLVWAAYNGLPLGLEKVGAVLGLEEQKLKEGKELIRYFCCPCRPTASNGGRTWNLPYHAKEKWELFKKYNQRDVEVELQIQQRLKGYPVPDSVWEEYRLDQEINDRGIMVDQEMVSQALRIDEISKCSLTARLQQITGLTNPNSVIQMKDYLAENGLETDSLGKKDVKALIQTAPESLTEVLELRLQLAKSSVRKYEAMQNAVCADGRCHGMFQFYGANRSGRWAGRLIQLQNLPQNHMPDLEQARDLVKQGDFDMLDMLYDSVPGVLSELIRTAFVPRPGFKFVVSDFSAIEARVLSHLAGEKWRMDLFKNGGDIYCQSASEMFKVPVEKHGQNAHLRQKGKIAELACIAEGELVLTNHGEKPIETVTMDDQLWDGESWVRHEGVVYKGIREVITYEGLTATPDHLVWVEGKSEPIQFGVASTSGARLVQTGDGGTAIRVGDHNQPGKEMESVVESLLCPDSLRGMQYDPMAEPEQSDKRQVERMPVLFTAEADPKLAGKEADCCETAMREPGGLGIPKLRRQRDSVSLFNCSGSRHISDEEIWPAEQGNGTGSNQYEWSLRAGKYQVCDQKRESSQPQEYGPERVQTKILAIQLPGCDSEIVAGTEPRRDYSGRGDCSIRKEEELADHQRKTRLYDIRNAGPHHRFTVSGYLVHNCGYGGSVGALKAMGALEMGLTEEELQPLVKLWRESNPHIVQYWWAVDEAVKETIRTHAETKVGNISFIARNGMLFISLPSGRRLSYVKPRIGENQFGGESVTYMGIDANKKWSRIESYGPKFVENIVQAISRDILAHAMRTLSYCAIVGHVHDELIIECSPDVSLETICEQMGRTPPWLPGIDLRADGYECPFYKKD